MPTSPHRTLSTPNDHLMYRGYKIWRRMRGVYECQGCIIAPNNVSHKFS
jgi:hypothetical protein